MKRFISILCLIFLLFVCTVPAFSSQAEPVRLGIIGFESRTDGVNDRQAEAITDIFTRQLANSRSITVLERERLAFVAEEIGLSAAALVNQATAVEVGKIVGVEYVLTGSVTGLNQKTTAGVIPLSWFTPIPVDVATGSNEVNATIDVRLIDTTTGVVRYAISEIGSSTSRVEGLTFAGMGFAGAEFGGLEGRAIEDAVNRLAHRIREIIGGEYPHVISVAGSRITIDKGSGMTSAGSLYLVYADGKSITNMQGEIIDQEKIPLAVIRVSNVSNASSTCTIVEPTNINMIRRGDKIEPITAQRSREMAKGREFATTRPPVSTGTFEAIFGGGEAAAPEAPPAGDAADNRLDQIADESGASAPPPPPVPAPAARTPAQPAGRREVPGVDPDTSTDAKVIETYGLDSAATNMLGIRHRGAVNKFNGRNFNGAYEDFIAMANEYRGNYLAAYWAGVTAHRLRKNDESLEWMDKALAINPNYKPAADFKRDTLKK